MEARLKLKYLGPAVEEGLMDVYQASANMIAFSEFMVVAAKAAYGEKIEARAEVAGFGRGSFITHLVFSFAGPIATIISAATPDHLLRITNDAFHIWKHLRGYPAKTIEQTDGQMVNVTNNDGDIVQVRIESLQIVFNEKATDAAGQFVRAQLSNSGFDGLKVESDKGVVAEVDQDDANSFRAVVTSESITDTAMDVTLILEAPVFKDGNKWRFSDGQTSFYADIVDREFMARVDAGELFGKGDWLRVSLRLVQDRSGAKITTERTVLKVYEHRRGMDQNKLF